MIQRIQTLFLLGLCLLMLSNIFVPFWKSQATEISTGVQGILNANPIALHFTANSQASFENKKDLYHIGALSLLVALNALFVILQFKNRKLQMRLTALNYLLISAMIACYFLAIDGAKKIFACSDIGYGIGFYLPLIAIVLNFFALRFIKKDEELIKSVDRLR